MSRGQVAFRIASVLLLVGCGPAGQGSDSGGGFDGGHSDAGLGGASGGRGGNSGSSGVAGNAGAAGSTGAAGRGGLGGLGVGGHAGSGAGGTAGGGQSGGAAGGGRAGAAGGGAGGFAGAAGAGGSAATSGAAGAGGAAGGAGTGGAAGAAGVSGVGGVAGGGSPSLDGGMDAPVDAPSDSGQSGDSGPQADAAVPSVRFAKPSGSVVYARAGLDVQILVEPDPPTQVQLLIDEVAVSALTSPFQTTLSTTPFAEGSHRLGCRATIDGVLVTCPAVTLIIDRTAPTIAATSPVPYSHPAPDTPLYAKFSEALSVASFATATVEVRLDGVVTQATASLSTDGLTLNVTLAGAHPGSTLGSVMVKGTLTDLAGNPMAAPPSWTWNWSNVVDVGSELSALAGEEQGYAPSIVVGSDGAPVVAWATWSATASQKGNRIITQRWDGVRWNIIGTFPDQAIALQQQGDPVVTMTAAGNPLVAWHDQDNSAGRFIPHVRAWNGTSWEVWDTGLPDGYRPRPVVDAAGNVSLGLTVMSPTQHSAVYRWKASAWQPLGDVMVVPGAMLTQVLSLAGDTAGNLELVWTDQGTQQFIPQRRRWNGSVWQVMTPPPYTGFGLVAPRVAMNGAGVTAFAWTVIDGAVGPQYDTIFSPGWSAPALFNTFTAGTVNDLEVDSMGRIAMTLGRLSPPLIYVERWSGAAWEAVFDGVQFSAAPDNAPDGDLAYAPSGKPFLVAYDRSGGKTKVYVVTLLNW